MALSQFIQNSDERVKEMSSLYETPKKLSNKARLFQIAVEVLEANGWKVERVAGNGKSSIRRIIKGSESKIVAIRTSQDQWIGFNRNQSDNCWGTLDDVDMVVAVSVDDKEQPKFVNVHFIDGDEIRDRFKRAYEARKNAGHKIPPERGIWISLYIPEKSDPVKLVGAGVGLKYPPIATVPLSDMDESLLSIAEAKRRLAVTFGVLPDNIKIIVEA